MSQSSRGCELLMRDILSSNRSGIMHFVVFAFACMDFTAPKHSAK